MNGLGKFIRTVRLRRATDALYSLKHSLIMAATCKRRRTFILLSGCTTGISGLFPNVNTLLSIYGAKLQNGTVLSELLASVNKTLVDRRSDVEAMQGVLRFMKTCVYTNNCVVNNPGISHLELTKAYYDTAKRDNYELSNAGNKLSI
ncbi:hypothetical protein EGH55_20360 [Klebsiella aerogenes]|nr:hypothetical protein EGH55_20360 [Klebsiella aerogenes]